MTQTNWAPKNPRRFTVALVTMLLCARCYRDPARGGLSAAWQVYAPAGQGFSVEMPGIPEVRDSDTMGLPTHYATVTIPQSIYLFSYMDVPESDGSERTFESVTDTALEGARSAFSERLNIECQRGTTRGVRIAGHQGLEAVITCGPTARSRIRMVNKSPRFFQMIVSGSAEAVVGSSANRFFDSLRLEVQ